MFLFAPLVPDPSSSFSTATPKPARARNRCLRGKLFNARFPLILPEKLTLSSVTHADGRLRVTAVEKREYTERTPEHDEERQKGGERITLKAYVHHLTRTLAAFEWDLNTNFAMLQITQLQEDGDYEKLADKFSQLVKPWLDIKQFGAGVPVQLEMEKAFSH
jgi:hypothetical protein